MKSFKLITPSIGEHGLSTGKRVSISRAAVRESKYLPRNRLTIIGDEFT